MRGLPRNGRIVVVLGFVLLQGFFPKVVSSLRR